MGEEEEAEEEPEEGKEKGKGKGKGIDTAILRLEGKKDLNVLEELAIEDRDIIQRDEDEEENQENMRVEGDENENDSYYTGTDEDDADDDDLEKNLMVIMVDNVNRVERLSNL